MRTTLGSCARPGRTSTALVLSYVFDWLVVIAAGVIGAVLDGVTPNKRPFSLVNPEISLPYVYHDKISTFVLVLCSLLGPAGIVFIVTIFLVPGPTVPKSTPKGLIWRRKLWEMHTGWLGLALSLAVTFFITDALKNLFGKPRPDLLSRCKPDLSNIAKYAVGGFADTQEGFVLVTHAICTNTDKDIMDDGFRSFPSGHCSFSAAGLVYLSLFLASKLALSIPFLSPSTYSSDNSRFAAFPSRTERARAESSQNKPQGSGEPVIPTGHDDAAIAARNQAAAPPVYLLALAVAPFFLCLYICSTRYSDFKHLGWDILGGFVIGTVCAIVSFRLYHLPISQGAGWSWGPRSGDRAFWAGIGVGSYANNDIKSDEVMSPNQNDVELGNRGKTPEEARRNGIAMSSESRY